MREKLRIIKALVVAAIFRRKTPLVLTMSVTSRCNRRCVYCQTEGGDDPSLDSLLSIIDQAARAGAIRINLTGGEPLLREDIGRIIDKALSLGLDVDMCTNGDFVRRRIDDLLRLHSVSLSLDGPEEPHDRNRGNDSYRNVIDAANLLKQKGVPVTLTCLICRDTDEYVDSLLAIAAEIDVPISFQPALERLLMAEGKNPFAPKPQKYRESIDKIIKAKRAGLPVANSIEGLQFLRRWPQKQDLSDCIFGRLVCRMEADNRLFMCSERSEGKLPFEIVQNGDFRKAFTRLFPSSCDECWGASRVELRLLSRLKFGPLVRLLTMGRIGSK